MNQSLWDLSLLSRTDTMEGENWLLQIVFWPPHIYAVAVSVHSQLFMMVVVVMMMIIEIKKNKGLSPQNETKHWPGYLRTVAFQEHSNEGVHPPEAGPQALESSAIE